MAPMTTGPNLSQFKTILPPIGEVVHEDSPQYLPVHFSPAPWICPRCGTVWAPHIQCCGCKSAANIYTSQDVPIAREPENSIKQRLKHILLHFLEVKKESSSENGWLPSLDEPIGELSALSEELSQNT